MSRFYASIQGSRGEATRQGTPKSGIQGHIRGWRVGVKVRGFNDNGHDVFRVYATSGSNGGCEEYIATVVLVPDGSRVEIQYPKDGPQ